MRTKTPQFDDGAQVLRAGRSIIFTEGRMSVGGATVARVNAILKPSGRPLADFAPGRLFD